MKVDAESRRQIEQESQGKGQSFRVIVRHSRRLGEARVYVLAGINCIHNNCDVLLASPSS